MPIEPAQNMFVVRRSHEVIGFNENPMARFSTYVQEGRRGGEVRRERVRWIDAA